MAEAAERARLQAEAEAKEAEEKAAREAAEAAEAEKAAKEAKVESDIEDDWEAAAAAEDCGLSPQTWGLEGSEVPGEPVMVRGPSVAKRRRWSSRSATLPMEETVRST